MSEPAADENRSLHPAAAAAAVPKDVGVMAVLAIALPAVGATATIAVGPWVAGWLRGFGPAGVVYFTAGFAALSALMLMPTYTTSVIAGWTFGFRVGFPAVVVGAVAGATLCYLAARRFAAGRVMEVFRAHAKWEIVRRALVEGGTWKTLWLVFLMRVSPVLPFGTTNVLLATTGVRPWVYVAGTVVGLAPRTAVVCLAAAGAKTLDLKAGESWWMIAGGVVATLICVSVIAAIGRRALERALPGEVQG